MGGQVFPGHIDDCLVNFHLGNLLHTTMFANLPQNTAITTTDDQGAMDPAMGHQRYVSKHFMIDEFVLLCSLDNTIQGHDPPENRVMKYQQVLVSGA